MASRGGNLGGRASDWLSLAAAPAFAIMALLTAVSDGDAGELHGAMPVGGMATMYALMSVFHAAPWLRLRRRQAATRG